MQTAPASSDGFAGAVFKSHPETRKLNKFLQQIFFFFVTSAMGELGVKHDRARARLD